MNFSIIVPSYNNIEYLKLLIKSIEKNSSFKNEIIVHVNEGSDGTLEFIKNKKIKFTYSENNIGLCSAVNLASKKSTCEYILYAHDDMYFCENWDLFLAEEINKINHNFFYISGMNISHDAGGYIKYDCGSHPKSFDENKFAEFCKNFKSFDIQGSQWAPHVIHKDLWHEIGGFSEEFDPGDGSDPDLCYKLWKKNVRIFKALSKFKVYHFGSVTLRRKVSVKNINRGSAKFILKWGLSPRTFRNHYLKGKKKIEYNGPLNEQSLTLAYIKDLLIDKLKYIYLKLKKK